MMPFGFLLDKSRRVALALSLCALAVVGSNAFGQATPGQLQQALGNPEVIRQRLMESGLSAVLILTGDVEVSYTLQVTREVFVFIPQVGQIFVSSLTLDQLRDVLYTRLGRVYSKLSRAPTATTHFAVEVTNVR